jgi:hypothetical protein
VVQGGLVPDVGMDSTWVGWVTKTEILHSVCTHNAHNQYNTVSEKQWF